MPDSIISMERKLPAPVSEVWAALTVPEQMRDWYVDIESFQPEIGYSFHFYGQSQGREWLHLCQVTDVAPRRKIQYSWRYDGYQGSSLLTFELFAENDSTRLRLTHEGVENFGPDFPFTAKDFREGWQKLIGEDLKKYLTK